MAAAHVNIGTMTVTRTAKGEKAIMILEVDERHPELKAQLQAIPDVESVTYFD